MLAGLCCKLLPACNSIVLFTLMQSANVFIKIDLHLSNQTYSLGISSVMINYLSYRNTSVLAK